jgi:lipopolysaccharide transport system permease protein
MLGIYSFAFGVVFKSRWPQGPGSNHPYAIVLFIGLIIHGFFSECLTRSSNLIVANPNFVKRVVFPLDILPWPVAFSALFHAIINIIVFACLMLAVEGRANPTILLVPIIFIPLLLFTMGVSWFMASLGVYFRDINQVMQVITTALLFLSSAVVPVKALPEKYQLIFNLNPLTFFIDQARQVALAESMPNWIGLVLATISGLTLAWLGHVWFLATQRGFSDVI